MSQGTFHVYSRGTSNEETFYARAFDLKIQGSSLPRDVVHDVIQVIYKDNIDKLDAFVLTLNNWDAVKRTYKYIGRGVSEEYERLFAPGQELLLYMGYQQPVANESQQRLSFMMRGQITALTPDFSSVGSPTLRVHGLNILHNFRKQPYTYLWENKRDSEIAQELARTPSETQPGLGIEVRIDDGALAKEAIEPVVFMENMTEIMFLLERARRHGYILSLNEEQNGQQSRPYLYFGPSSRDTFTTYSLEWGKSLSQFCPTLTTANQVEQVTVQGWDRKTQQLIEETATWGDADLRVNLDLRSFIQPQALQKRKNIVVACPVYTQAQAKAMARDLLLANLKEMITAEGSTLGLAELRAGRQVQIVGTGKRFDGTYFTTSTTHTADRNGYRTAFTARREQV